MEFIGTNNSVDVVGLYKSGKLLQIIINHCSEVQVNGIIVIQFNDSKEVLGIIDEIDSNHEHQLLYVEVNPNTSNVEEVIKNKSQIKSILLWGAL